MNSKSKQAIAEVKGKTVEMVELNVEAGYYGISIRFQDKTSLTFSIESRVAALPIYSQWADGEEKIIKQYELIGSEQSI